MNGITSGCNRYGIRDSVVPIGDTASSCWVSSTQDANQGKAVVEFLTNSLMSYCSTGVTLQEFTRRRKLEADISEELCMEGFGSNGRVILVRSLLGLQYSDKARAFS